MHRAGKQLICKHVDVEVSRRCRWRGRCRRIQHLSWLEAVESATRGPGGPWNVRSCFPWGVLQGCKGVCACLGVKLACCGGRRGRQETRVKEGGVGRNGCGSPYRSCSVGTAECSFLNRMFSYGGRTDGSRCSALLLPRVHQVRRLDFLEAAPVAGSRDKERPAPRTLFPLYLVSAAPRRRRNKGEKEREGPQGLEIDRVEGHGLRSICAEPQIRTRWGGISGIPSLMPGTWN